MENTITITIIITILSTIVIIIQYFDLFRYYKLRHEEISHYIEKYSDVKPYKLKKSIIVSLNTTPDRIGKIKPVLNSLLDQSIRVNKIIVNVYSKSSEPYELPENYKKVGIFNNIKKDYQEKPNLSILNNEGESETKIIFLSDKTVYGEDFIETLVDESDNNPDSIIHTKENSRIDVLIKPKFFTVENLEKEEFPNVKKIKISYMFNFPVL
jgi:hypothetical protein